MKTLGNIEYHMGWVQEKNPEPDKLHNIFSYAEKNGLVIGGISPSELGESMVLTNDNSLRESATWTRQSLKKFFKDEAYANSGEYTPQMVEAMLFVISFL